MGNTGILVSIEKFDCPLYGSRGGKGTPKIFENIKVKKITLNNLQDILIERKRKLFEIEKVTTYEERNLEDGSFPMHWMLTSEDKWERPKANKRQTTYYSRETETPRSAEVETLNVKISVNDKHKIVLVIPGQ
jgi:hypothetical protein